MSKHTPTLVWLVLCLVIVLVNWNCAPTLKDITLYPIEDLNRIQHQYRDDIKSFMYPLDNAKLTQYCAIHFEWEDIHTKWGIENNEFGWSYRVIKHRKAT